MSLARRIVPGTIIYAETFAMMALTNPVALQQSWILKISCKLMLVFVIYNVKDKHLGYYIQNLIDAIKSYFNCKYCL